MKQNALFHELFVLEIANNHWGDVARGVQIIRQHSAVVHKHGVKAAIKFQFRDVDTFIHEAFLPQDAVEREGEVVQPPGSSSRYVKKTVATKLSQEEFAELLAETKRQGLITMATPFDEASVAMLEALDVEIVKIASQDAKAWTLVERIAALRRPTIISNGGTGVEDLDRVVALFREKNVPLAINHCVSLYPSEDHELELNQIDFLRARYPDHVIGFSTHEYRDWSNSMLISYAKGARTWERHVDIEDATGTPVSPYCSLPHQIDEWFAAFKKAKEMCGREPTEARHINERELAYVRSVSRGAYALRPLKKGHVITKEGLGKDFKLVIPLQENQISARDLNEPITLDRDIAEGAPIPFPAGRSGTPAQKD